MYRSLSTKRRKSKNLTKHWPCAVKSMLRDSQIKPKLKIFSKNFLPKSFSIPMAFITSKKIAKTFPEPPETRPRTSLRLPKCSQDASRTLQDDSSWPQDTSKILQDAVRTRTRHNSEAKSLPRHCQDPPQPDFGRFGEAFGNVSIPSSDHFLKM